MIERPNERDRGDILPFITLSQVTHQSEHFSKAVTCQQVFKTKKENVFFVWTCVPLCDRTCVCAQGSAIDQFPKPGLFSIMFYAPSLLNQSGACSCVAKYCFSSTVMILEAVHYLQFIKMKLLAGENGLASTLTPVAVAHAVPT